MQTNNLNNNSSDYHSASSKDVYNNLYLSEDSSIDSGVENRFRSKNVSRIFVLNCLVLIKFASLLGIISLVSNKRIDYALNMSH